MSKLGTSDFMTLFAFVVAREINVKNNQAVSSKDSSKIFIDSLVSIF